MRRNKNSLHHPSGVTRPVSLRLERWQRRSIYAVCALLAISGLCWLLAHFGLRGVGEFGETVHPLEPWSMKVHGAAAMLALFFVGTMFNGHVRRALKAQRNRGTGLAMIAVFLALALTGYALYYVAGEGDRPVWSAIHWIIGLAMLFLIVIHIVLGRKSVATM
jgi:uncharacterized membrane protein